MAKPAITLRSNTAPTPLTYTQLDTNFTNLRDATISLTAGTGGTAVISDLNGNITLVAGTGISLAGNNTAKTITITSTSGSNSFSTITVDGTSVVADSTSDTLTFNAGAGLDSSVDTGSDTITFNLSSSQTIITSINPGSNALTLQSTASGANLNFNNGSVYSKNYYLSAATPIANTSTPTVDLTPAGGLNGTAFTLQTAISSLSVTLSADPSMMRQQYVIFTTDTGGGTFTISTSQSALWVDGAKTCTRDGSTYVMQIHCYDADNTAPHGNNYFIELLPFS
jgi:hypothetical protein